MRCQNRQTIDDPGLALGAQHTIISLMKTTPRVTMINGRLLESPPPRLTHWTVDMAHPLIEHDLHEQFSLEEAEEWAEKLAPKGYRVGRCMQIRLPVDAADERSHGQVRDGAIMIRALRVTYVAI
jgi:hypothetical protein